VPRTRRRIDLPEGAMPAELPDLIAPELATLVDKPPGGGQWLYEIKFDGYRMLARIEGSQVRIVTRRGNDWTARFPALVKDLKKSGLPDGWYDGEIVVLQEDGTPSFNALQNAIESDQNDAIVFYLFDAPFVAGHDLRRVGVEQRRAVLQAVLAPSHRVRYSAQVDGPPAALLKSACDLGLEGVIGKRLGSPYVHRRSDDWIKLKCVRRQEFVIGGYTWPDEGRVDMGIGALLVGTWVAGKLQYAGKVGTGFSVTASTKLRRQLDAIVQKQRPFAGATGHDRHATWVRPELVCEVAYNEWPEEGSLRHASFKGLREDKAAGDAVSGSVRPEPVEGQGTRLRQAQPERLRSTVDLSRFRVTNPDRVLDPSTGLTKLDMVRYYVEVAPWLLPHLHGRPAYMRRAPKGIEAPMPFQQHTLEMKGLRGTDPKLWPGHDPAIAFESVEDLAAAAQLDMVEIHTWNSTARAITLPDRMVLDLDPDENLPWAQVRQAAELVRTLLQELGLRGWLKTTGGKGLHVFAPLAPELRYPQVKAFSESLVLHLARTVPQLFVAKSGPRNRVGKVFIDYLRNGWVQSTAETLSARGKPGLGVSMPIAWEQLDDVAHGAHWTIADAVPYLKRRRRDPWVDYWTTPQSLLGAMRRLGHSPAAEKR
jgi:bifunctional non-homologous end joining protein LigD